MQANVRLEHELLAVEHEPTVHCMLELDAPPAEEAERLPLHVALVVDRSGSMSGEKLHVARECAAYLASRLRPTDRFALITFDDDVQLVSPLGPVRHDVLRARIDAIFPGGSTNLSGGWLKAIEELGRIDDDATRRVIVLTDGHANVGITRPHQLVQIAEASASQAATTTIGFGADFDEQLLRSIADASGANTWFAETPDDAPAIFGSEFDGLASLVAQNVSVELRPGRAVQLLEILHEYPAVEVDGGVQLQLGDTYGSERRRVVFELRVRDLAALGPARVAEIVVRYVALGAKTAHHELRVPVTVNLVSADEAAAAAVDHEVTEEVRLMRAAKARRSAIDAADDGDDEGTARMLFSAASELRAFAAEAPTRRADEFSAEADGLDEHARSLRDIDRKVWRKRMFQEEWQRTRGRPGPERDEREDQ